MAALTAQWLRPSKVRGKQNSNSTLIVSKNVRKTRLLQATDAEKCTLGVFAYASVSRVFVKHDGRGYKHT